MILDGFKVLDFGQAVFAPRCAEILGDLGADVIKVEPLEGDLSRFTALREGDSITFLSNNRSKRSIAIDLREQRGKDIALKLVENADIILQNFRPGVMTKMGLDYDSICKINPAIIYGSFYMYGETGPLARRTGGDLWAQAFTGLVASQGSPEGPPYLAGHAFIDYAGSVFNAFGIVCALLERERTGKGQEITNNLINTGAYLQALPIETLLIDGVALKKMGRGSYRGWFPYGAYPASDGDVVTFFGQDDAEWPVFCTILGIEHLLEDPRYNTAEKRATGKFELYPVLDEAFRKKTRAEWESIFRANGFRCDGCLDYAEFVAHPQFEANDMVVEVNHPRDGKIKMLGFPVKFKGSEKPVDLKPPPILGEHTEEILGEHEYSQEAIEDLKEQGIVGTPTADMFVPVKRSILRSTQVSRRYDRKKAEIKKQKKQS